jgi:hypothetical protein
MTLFYRAVLRDAGERLGLRLRRCFAEWTSIDDDGSPRVEKSHGRTRVSLADNSICGRYIHDIPTGTGRLRTTVTWAKGKHDADNWIAVTVEGELSDSANPVDAPGFLARFLETGRVTDGVAPLDSPIVCGQDELGPLVDWLTNPARTVPIIIISVDHLNPQISDSHAKHLSKALIGIAIVVRLFDIKTQEFFNRKLGKDLSVFGGGLRTYMPGLTPGAESYPSRHPIRGGGAMRDQGVRALDVVVNGVMDYAIHRPLPSDVRQAEPRVTRILAGEAPSEHLHPALPTPANLARAHEIASEADHVEPEESPVRSDAGFHPDTDSGDDHLGIAADVQMLADLIASRRVVPPLSIGLFGAWGSGKSFFMRKMRARVSELAQATATAEQAAGKRGPSVSAYCSEIRQVTFNAWHYSESNLWASLATHLLDSLASSGADGDLERHANDLAERRRHQRSLLDQLSSVRVERMLLTARLERQDQDSAPGDIARSLASILAAEDWLTDGATPLGDTLAEVNTFIDEATGLTAELRNFWHRLVHNRTTRTVFILGAVAAVVVFVLADSAMWSAGIASLTTMLSLLPTMRKIRASVNRIRRAGDELTATAGTPTRTRLASLDIEQARLEQAIADLAPSQDLAAFARFRHQSQDYRQHLGIVSLVRRDLETFAAMLAAGLDVGDRNAGPERIVLYIDDLDRCPPNVVVKVLEAVNLLLAQPVFAIVVAADADWLVRSLNEHYGLVLQGGIEEESRSGARHYLEKIFQVTLKLAPMSGTGFTKLVTNLLQEREGEAGSEISSVSQPDSQWPPSELISTDKLSSDSAPNSDPLKADGFRRTAASQPPPRRLNLRPPQLEITQKELAFIATLAPLAQSPRGAKRLINLYRLLRARLQTDELAGFVDGSGHGYRAVLVLLALTVGPSDPSELFQAIEDAPEDVTWPGLAAKFPHLDIKMDAPSDITMYQRWLPTVRRFSFASSLSS